MPTHRHQNRPGVERLDARLVLSTAVIAPPAHLTPGQYPGADAHRAFTPADLRAYATAYETCIGSPGYTPQYDFNGTGFIGQNDAKPILDALAAITPKVPIGLSLALAPGEQVVGHHPSNSGGVTRSSTVTIIGKTTPNSIVFSDALTPKPGMSTLNFKFQGAAIATDSQGDFEETVPLSGLSRGGSLTNTDFLIRTPFGQQLIRSFPIRRLP